MRNAIYTTLKKFLRKFRHSLSIFQTCSRAAELVWETNRILTLRVAFLTLVAGLLPAAVAYLSKLIIDGVILAAQSGLSSHKQTVLSYVGIEALAVAILTGSQQGIALNESLLRLLLKQKVNVLIFKKALTMKLAQFEDSDFYDKMMQAQEESSSRPLSLVKRTFGLARDTLSLITYGVLMFHLSAFALLMLLATAIPAFISETRFANEAFSLFHWNIPETREQQYLEALITRADYVMEGKIYQLGQKFLERSEAIFTDLYWKERKLILRSNLWLYLLSLFSLAAFYFTYIWIALEAISGKISVGELTLYLVIFRQGASAFSSILTSVSGLYEDALYMSNLYEFLDQKIQEKSGCITQGTSPRDGIRFQNVSFSYPNSGKLVLKEISFHLRPGETLAIVGKNGCGKTTLFKLLSGLYTPNSGCILLDGSDLRQWDIRALRERIAVLFQNFAHYQFTIGENIGLGDLAHLEDQHRWRVAAKKATAFPFIEETPQKFFTQLGRLVKKGRELSGGQWQKLSLARALMRTNADILLLDEPTSEMDTEAELAVFSNLRTIGQDKMVIIISHRFCHMRTADQIIVLDDGEILEHGSHDELIKFGGLYARLFVLQVESYKGIK